MSVSAPHFLLFAHATGNRLVGATAGRHDEVEMEMGGRWRFILQTPEGKTFLDVEDEEEGDSRERLELLAIVRGLEALDQPSQVTLHTNSRAISRGINEGLAQWRENDYQWERFGTMTPIKNRDLWQRVDHAMQIHQVQCRLVSSGGMDDLSLPPPADEQPMKITTRRHRGRELRFDSGEPGTPQAAAPPRRTRTRQRAPEPAPSFWQQAVSGVRRLFSR
jgi:ribonuclease HI